MSKTVDIADEIYRELGGAESGLIVPAIAFWLVSNIGKLNTLLNTSYSIEDQNITPDLGESEKDIFKQIYIVNFYTRKVNANLGAAGYDAGVLEVTEGNKTVRLVNRNEISKSFQSLKRDEQTYLELLVSSYKINKAIPRQVVGGEEEPWGGMNPELGGGATQYRDFYDLE